MATIWFRGVNVRPTGTTALSSAQIQIGYSGGSLANAFELATSAGTPYSASFTAQPVASSVSVGSALSSQPIVKVYDRFGNERVGDSVTLSLSGGTSGATVSCTANPVTTTSSGASFAGCKLDKSGTGFTLVATSGGATKVSNSFNVAAVAPTGAAVKATSGTNSANSITNASKGAVSVDVTFPSGGPAETGTVTASLTDTNGSSVTGRVTVGAGAASSTSFTVTGIDATSLADGPIAVSGYFTGGATSSTLSGTTATKSLTATVLVPMPVASAIRIKSGPTNEQDVINKASTTAVYLDAGFATAPGTGQLSTRLVSAGTGGSCSDVVGSTTVNTIATGQTNFVVGPMNASCLADGAVTVSASFADDAGNTGTSVTGTVAATKDTVAPQQPSLTAMTVINNVPGTPDSLAVLSSVGGAGDVIKVWRDATFTSLISSGPATSNLTVPLGDNHELPSGRIGLSAVYVSVEDAAGNLSSPTEVTIDNFAPSPARSLAFAATGGTVVANTLNATNTGFSVTATIQGDVGSAGGTAELML
ncbi:MAG: hypothetical protein EBT09_11390, partial [Actinobacteria bacterium]|nr:hypothetical protein [Actinomycetota bacterium]